MRGESFLLIAAYDFKNYLIITLHNINVIVKKSRGLKWSSYILFSSEMSFRVQCTDTEVCGGTLFSLEDCVR